MVVAGEKGGEGEGDLYAGWLGEMKVGPF